VRRALQLGSDLTLMMLIEVDPARSAALHTALAAHQRTLTDVHLITRTTQPAPAPTPGALTLAGGGVGAALPRAARFHMAAIDRPGLVHTVTSAPPHAQHHVLGCGCACVCMRACLRLC
jgi:hypothetical protein